MLYFFSIFSHFFFLSSFFFAQCLSFSGVLKPKSGAKVSLAEAEGSSDSAHKKAVARKKDKQRLLVPPEWFRKQLPPGVYLDGELWGGYGNAQKVKVCVSTVLYFPALSLSA